MFHLFVSDWLRFPCMRNSNRCVEIRSPRANRAALGGSNDRVTSAILGRMRRLRSRAATPAVNGVR
ncbi:MAG: hypothetical protein DCC65_10145 [Planctomycetota bacterium]|nr:MAG: hypothetical protein DCC65_10145 [Planctomycetota bacterium]